MINYHDTLQRVSTLNAQISTPGCAACKSATGTATALHAGLGSQIGTFFSGIFSTADWPARWHCGTWSDFHGWLYIFSDLLIWACYFAIPILLIWMLNRRKDVPFNKIIWLFVAFIILCGTTHLLDAIIFWWPAYRLSALIRLLTGLVSACTVYALYKIMPTVLMLRSVKELEYEINERTIVENKLNESYLLLSQSNQQLRSFTHILSHNIRNHSSNISLLTTMVNPKTLEEDNLELFERIAKVSNSLLTTLNDLSAAIKIRETSVAAQLMSFSEVAAATVDILESELLANRATVEFEFNVEAVMFPKLYLESVFINLISNAVKYKKDTEAPVIKLSSFRNENGRTVLTCADNGIGIDLDLHGEKIFGLYKTFHGNKNAHGVGLFLVKTQVESQGGSVAVISKPENGAIFKITF